MNARSPSGIRPRTSRGLFATVLFAWGLLTGCGKEAYVYSADDAVYAHFSGEEAMRHVVNLVSIGPRVSGTEGAEKARQYIEQNLAACGWTTERQAFRERTPVGVIDFANIRARFSTGNPAEVWNRRPGVLIASHYDTKLYNDFLFLGANDSGSSTGALLEIARITAQKPLLAEQLELVFFDGEEAFLRNITDTDGLYGSRHYRNVMRVQAMAAQRPVYGVLLDMIGDRNLNIEVPSDSPPLLENWLMQSAKDLNVRQFFGRRRTPILDDHVPLNQAGIPTIDIIDLDYGPWHTQGDTLDAISAESIQIVSKTALLMIEKYLLPSLR